MVREEGRSRPGGAPGGTGLFFADRRNATEGGGAVPFRSRLFEVTSHGCRLVDRAATLRSLTDRNRSFPEWSKVRESGSSPEKGAAEATATT